MPQYETETELLETVRDRLDGWLYRAKERAFEELFEGPDALLTDEERRLLDGVDSRLSRRTGQGLWNADEYGIVATGTLDEENTPRVVCTAHPRLPEEVYPGEGTLDAALRERLNDALWQYSQRVTELAQQELTEFVLSADVDTWNG